MESFFASRRVDVQTTYPVRASSHKTNLSSLHTGPAQNAYSRTNRLLLILSASWSRWKPRLVNIRLAYGTNCFWYHSSRSTSSHPIERFGHCRNPSTIRGLWSILCSYLWGYWRKCNLLCFRRRLLCSSRLRRWRFFERDHPRAGRALRRQGFDSLPVAKLG
jgi:hypothetical protein